MLKLIIDGCNGPIRFRRSCLEKAVGTNVETKDVKEDSINNDTKKNSARNDVGETTLSFLRPESIKPLKTSYKLCNSDRSKKNKNGRRNKNNKPKICADTDSVCFEESPNRMDMIPLLEKLLVFSTLGEEEKRSNSNRLFNSISVIFDGVSMTKRSPVPVDKNNNQSRKDGDVTEDEIIRGRHWCVTNDTAHSKTVVVTSENGLYDGIDKSGNLVIEITGLYDEADNVIVERIQEHRRQNTAKECALEPKGPLQANDAEVVCIKLVEAATRIQILRRTDRGAGKNRRLFKSLGLLRPESVACIFDFSAVLETPNIDSDKEQREQDREYLNECKQSRFISSSFRQLAIDGDQTLRSVRRHNPGNVFVALEEPLEFSHNSNDNISSPVIPIVVTDDVFLRQRIVHEGGFIMNFHQLWLLLRDVV